MKTETACAFIVCCVVFGLDTFGCGESLSIPDDNNVLQLNITTKHDMLTSRNNTLTTGRNMPLTKNKPHLNNSPLMKRNGALITTRNDTSMTSNQARVTSPFLYDPRTIGPLHGYTQRLEHGNNITGKERDVENSGQNSYNEKTTDQMSDSMLVVADVTEGDDLPKCPSYDDIHSFDNTNLELTQFQKTQYKHDVRIKNSKECSHEYFISINSSTLLNVEIDGAVSNCSHVITIVSTQLSSNIIFKFIQFGVPGKTQVKGTNAIKCSDTLDIFEVYKPRHNESMCSLYRKFGPYCSSNTPRTFRYIEHERAKFVLQMSEQTQCCDKMSFNVIALPCKRIPHKSRDCNKSIISSYGEVITPGFSLKRRYPNNIACAWTISTPQGTYIQLNPIDFNVGKGDVVSITATNRNSSLQFPQRLNFSDQNPWVLPYVVPSNECVLEFRSDEFVTGDGFNVTFHAVTKTQFLPLLDDGRFNCSGIINLPDSITCNFLSDCVDKRDEKNCSYKQPECPDGYVFDNYCFWIKHNYNETLSWISARKYCYEYNASSLISFQTERKRKFYDKLQKALQIRMVFLGLRRSNYHIKMYKRFWEWTDNTYAFYLPGETTSDSQGKCSMFVNDHFYAIDCNVIFENITIVCERILYTNRNMILPNIPKLHPQLPWSDKLDVFPCGSGEIISVDRKCDRNADCFDNSDEEGCGDYSEFIYKRFICDNSQMVAYTFVCDGFSDCWDRSDELFCFGHQHQYSNSRYDMYSNNDLYGSCPENTTSCPGLYCMPNSWITDSEIDCPVRDWRGKRVVKENVEVNRVRSIAPPGIVIPDGYGKFVIKPLAKTDQCPSTHSQCLDGFCIPFSMFGNNLFDCPYKEDENTERLAEICNGAYKCRKSKRCIRFNEVCDGKFDCPSNDDETLCSTVNNMTCPIGCTCVQKEFVCTGNFRFDRQPLIKAHSFSITSTDLSSFTKFKLDSHSLIFLEAPRNRIKTIEDGHFIYPNLKVLNLSNNEITYLPTLAFKQCLVLEALSLASNSLRKQQFSFLQSTPNLKYLDISGNLLPTIKDRTFFDVAKLTTLILRNMGIKEIRAEAFWGLSGLKVLDLKGNGIITFSPLVFEKQARLLTLTTDNFRLCCKQIAPRRISKKGICVTTYDDISSCDDMLRTNFLRTSLWVMALLTILGNVGVICHRIFWDKSNRLTYRVLITCLSLSDLVMGVYLVIIGTADVMYRDRFLSMEEEWKDSLMCRVAGHLCVLSSEVSALLILVVTVDRALAIALPLRRGIPLSNRSVGVVCVFVWLAGMIIASIPILPPFNSWELYSQLAVGVPLPLTRNRFPGYEFAFAIFIVLNVTTFILVVLGQLVIWLAIKKRSKVIMTQARMKQDLAIAQKLFLVVLTDCVCWFPISVMGLLGFRGIAVPGTMHIVATVFLLPANSALNPFLYTLNSLLLKRRKKNPSTSRAM